MKKLLLMSVMVLSLISCSREADIASKNLSRSADEFEIKRRVVFYNGITGEYILTIEGLCSLGNDRTANGIFITCKTGPKAYKKHFLGISSNVTFFMEQLEAANVSPYHYKVIFKPTSIVPDIEVK